MTIEICVQKVLSQLLEFVVENLVEDETYLHRNGFIKVTFIRNGEKQRIHVWNYAPEHFEEYDLSKYLNTQSTPHNHPWDFTSRVLCGTLKVTMYSEVYGHDFEKYNCTVNGLHGEGHTISHVGKSGLVSIFEAKFTKGTSYSQSRHIIHDISPYGDELVATHMKVLKVKRSVSTIYSTRRLEEKNKNMRIGISKLRRILEEVNEKIGTK